MESLAWSICVRQPQLFVAPSPRSFVFNLLNKDHSPVWRRWAECSGFSPYRRRREHSPTPGMHTCVRESRANQRSPRVSLPPPVLQGTPTPTAHLNTGRSSSRATAAEGAASTPTAARRRLLIKSNSFSPHGSLLLKEPAYSTIHPLHSMTKQS